MNQLTADDIGKQVILDAKYANASTVKLESLGNVFAEVSSLGRVWSVMRIRLSKPEIGTGLDILNNITPIHDHETHEMFEWLTEDHSDPEPE